MLPIIPVVSWLLPVIPVVYTKLTPPASPLETKKEVDDSLPSIAWYKVANIDSWYYRLKQA
jgi:hypothetical protein